MNEEGTKLLDDGVMVFDGHAQDPTVEGPKLYKRNGYYYIFAPAGGVESGWQLALRSKNIYGRYERRVVLAQGKTNINGPHQGAWVETQSGESWFIHFQDKGAYGRVVHLQPMKWVNDWPIMGANGEPVMTNRKPNVGRTYPLATPADSDEFNDPRFNLQWQWSANPQSNWAFPAAAYGFLRILSVPPPKDAKNFWDVPNLLLQKFPAPSFTATAKVTFTALNNGDRTGLIVTGLDYAYLSVEKKQDGLRKMRFAVLALALTEKRMFPWDSNSKPVKANGLGRRLVSSQSARGLFRKWVTPIMTGSELNNLSSYFNLLCDLCASASSVLTFSHDYV